MAWWYSNWLALSAHSQKVPGLTPEVLQKFAVGCYERAKFKILIKSQNLHIKL